MKRTLRVGLLLLGTLLAGTAQSQGLPETRIWLAELREGLPQAPRPVTAAGSYNNQPLFTPEGGQLYFAAEQSDGQTDVMVFEIATGMLRRLAHSPESEYSPTPIPGQDAVSVIRVEADGRQRLWRIDAATGKAGLLLPNVQPVGYHTWYSDNAVAMFILGDSFTLQKAVIGDASAEFVFDNIGRTLRRHPHSGRVLFVDKNSAPWTIRSIDIGSGETAPVIPLLPGHEDFEVDNQGRYWMGSGSKLYRGDTDNRHWRLAVDLSEYGVRNITRLGISPDGTMLAIVGSP